MFFSFIFTSFFFALQKIQNISIKQDRNGIKSCLFFNFIFEHEFSILILFNYKIK